MTLHANLAAALRQARKHAGVTQEDFSNVSSRTYLSSLERGLKSPTLEKVEQIAGVLQIHPVSLIALAYVQELPGREVDQLLARVKSEIEAVLSEPKE